MSLIWAKLVEVVLGFGLRRLWSWLKVRLKVKEAQDAGKKELEDTAGLSDDDVVDRVRRREQDWRDL